MNKLKLSALFAVMATILGASVMIGCGGKDNKKTSDNKTGDNQVGATDTARAINGDWVVIRDVSDPDKLNPIVSTSANADEIESYIYETLLNQDKLTYELF